MARAAARLQPVTSGRIFLAGKDVTFCRGKNKRAIYRLIQMVFQQAGPSFDPRQTIGAGIRETLRNRGLSGQEAGRRAEILLEQCGLARSYAVRYPYELSGGQCQRAAIARALAAEPAILILDEATSALDVTVQRQILELLKQLQRRYGMSYLMISHDLAVVQELCSRVLVMHKGHIIEEGTPDQVIRSPRHPYVKQLAGAAILQTGQELF